MSNRTKASASGALDNLYSKYKKLTEENKELKKEKNNLKVHKYIVINYLEHGAYEDALNYMKNYFDTNIQRR